jgi:hypothetical protein
LINTSGICTKCGSDTGAEWKTLCRSCWNKRTPDEIRAYTQAKLDKKAARIRKKAERLKKNQTVNALYLMINGEISLFSLNRQHLQAGSAGKEQECMTDTIKV